MYPMTARCRLGGAEYSLAMFPTEGQESIGDLSATVKQVQP
jgi:hypothetical protein